MATCHTFPQFRFITDRLMSENLARRVTVRIPPYALQDMHHGVYSLALIKVRCFTLADDRKSLGGLGLGYEIFDTGRFIPKLIIFLLFLIFWAFYFLFGLLELLSLKHLCHKMQYFLRFLQVDQTISSFDICHI